MRTRPCVFLKQAATSSIKRRDTTKSFPLLPFLLIGAILLFPVRAFPSEQPSLDSHMPTKLEAIVVIVELNTETMGEFFVNYTADRDFFVKTADLKSMGLRDVTGATVEVANEQYMSLKSIKGISFVFNENTLSLELTAVPSLLPKKELDFLPQRRPDVIYTRDSAAFLNYRLDYFAGKSFRFQSFDLISQLGVRTHDLLFLTDSNYTKTPEGDHFVRLFSNITYDKRPDLQRLVIGDFTATSGDLGSSVIMGGLSLSKVYDINPYLIKYPLANFGGFTTLPATMEVFINEMRIRTEKIRPGEFTLSNMYYYGGANNVVVMIRDAFGRVQTVRYPFYSTDVLLNKGLHEYSYNLGFIRNRLGIESNNYRGLAFSGFHRYGIVDSLTVGMSAEGGRGNYNLGAQAAVLLERAGVVSLALSGSRNDDGRTGSAGTLNYAYQDRRMNAHFFFKNFTRDYAAISTGVFPDRTKYEAGAAIGYSTQDFGSLSAALHKIGKYIGQDSRSLMVSYTRNLSPKISLFAAYTRKRETISSNTFFVGLTYYPREGITVSTNYEKGTRSDSEALQIQKTLPVGEGVGYRALISRVAKEAGEITTANPAFQYNAPFGTYTAEYARQSTSAGPYESYNFSASGAIAYVGNTIGFSRTINDSFGVVKVGSLEGVRVYQNNQEIGRTDTSGRIFVPNLGSYYDNQVSIADKDIPIDYSMKEVIKYISPPLRSGSIIDFDVTKLQAITGMLKRKTDKGVLPVEFREVSMMVNGREMTFPTGKDGEFYFENVKPGTYRASFDVEEKKCLFDIIIPEVDEMIIDLGGLTCEELR